MVNVNLGLKINRGFLKFLLLELFSKANYKLLVNTQRRNYFEKKSID